MASPLLQGFTEIRPSRPIGKSIMTVTPTFVRFNKATAAALGYPAYVKVLVNDRTKQIAVVATSSKSDSSIKFSKPAEKQAASITVHNDALVGTLSAYFTFADVPEGEISYHTLAGEVHVNDKAIIFNIAQSETGIMKRRGRRKAADTADTNTGTAA
ncbi:hypothetical protein [Bifidobacterium jacchi]|uniref:Uncharacterized protein n=1 Tax=Bifidobacterium jacchi TaxID=2490545 RepID=A0A5N5RDI9_9BIFI|nr:hypothetical protein [Bifidobacterium jacchi]KAB5605372.1 hypothetical protein EHS19_09345 [Bifidobacterium jacchi]